MLNLRTFIVAGAAVLASAVTAAQAQGYRTTYPELVFAKVPDENASGTSDRWTPLANYLSKELGVKVTLRIANDYAAVIEGQLAGNIHIAMYGPASYAREAIAVRTTSTTWSPVAPGVSTPATPAARSLATSASGTIPPTTTGMSAPRSRTFWTTFGASVMCAPESIDSPMASTSSSTAAAATVSGVWKRPV